MKSFSQMIKDIPHLGEEAIKRTWREVRHAPHTRFNSKQKKRLVTTLKARKVEKMLQKKIHTVRRKMTEAARGLSKKKKKTKRKTRKNKK